VARNLPPGAAMADNANSDIADNRNNNKKKTGTPVPNKKNNNNIFDNRKIKNANKKTIKKQMTKNKIEQVVEVSHNRLQPDDVHQHTAWGQKK
jgi:hypothetical protein